MMRDLVLAVIVLGLSGCVLGAILGAGFAATFGTPFWWSIAGGAVVGPPLMVAIIRRFAREY